MKIRTLLLSALTSLLVLWLYQPSASAQRTLTGTNYTEGFESIAGGSLPTGWSCRFNIDQAPPVGPVGDELPFTNGVTTWSGATIGLPYNMASVFNIDPGTALPFWPGTDATAQNNATNRAPGQRLSSGTDGETAWTLQIANTIGLADFIVSMDLLCLTTNNRTGIWTVDYAVGNAPVSFTPLGYMGDIIIDGTNAFGATNSGALVIPADANNQGQNLWIRLALLTDTVPSGGRDTYGIDNFVLNYTGGVVDTSPPSVTTQPQSITNNAGSTALFTVEADGAPTLAYQWRKNGTALLGENLASLTLNEVVTSNAGGYDVVITNNYGSKTSAVATLTVVADPGLAVSFASLTNMPGDAIRVTTSVAGTIPKTYQWYKDGVAIGGASGELTNDVVNTVGYTVTANATAADEGTYSLVVSNALGVITGAVASVTILPAPSTQIASWNYNSLVNDNDTSTGVDTPAIGTGTCFITFETTLFEFRNGADFDPADLDATNDNSGYTWKGVLPGFNKVSGVEVSVATTGYQNILVSWNQNNNSRASRYMRFQYSTDGINFTDAKSFDLNGQDTWLLLSDALYGITGVENNPNFKFRVVAEWQSTASGSGVADYVENGGTSFSAANGVYIMDKVSVWGNPVGTPEAPINITKIAVSGGVVTVTFKCQPWDTASEFTLMGSSTANGTYGNLAATMSDISPGVFQATIAAAGPIQFYKVKH